MKILKVLINISLLTSSLFFSYFLAGYLYNPIYSFVYRSSGNGLFMIYEGMARFLSVLVLGFIFFIFLNFTAFGDSKKYWWITILLIPVIIFEVYFDWDHLYIPVAIGILGWIIGLILSKVKTQLLLNN